MRRSANLSLIFMLLSLFLLLGCSKKEEPVQTQAPAPQTVPAPVVTKETSQLDKALLIHRDFVQAFSTILNKQDTVASVQERIDLVDKTRVSCMLLRPDIQDPVAADFLIRFSDGLDKYLSLCKDHLATLQEVDRLLTSGKEIENTLPGIPEKEKGPATSKLNALIEQHKKLVQGPLQKERTELDRLGTELMGLK